MNNEPELQNWEEIELLSKSSSDTEGKLGFIKALHKVTIGIVNSKNSISGLTPFIARIGIVIEQLNKNLQKADESSTKLTQALNRITFYGVIVAGFGVLVAVGGLILEIYKICHKIQ